VGFRGVYCLAGRRHLGEHADATPLQHHIVRGDHLHRINSCMGDERYRLVDQPLEELLLVVLDDWELVMITGEYLSWIPMNELLVESLGLTKACDTFQSYSQLQMFLLACPDIFIIDNNMMRDRPWLRTWGLARPRPPDMSIFTTSSQIEVDHHRKPIETWCVVVSIIVQVIVDEHRGFLTVICLTQEQLEEIGSDKLPSFPWDPGVHLANRMFYYRVTQVVPESHTLHLRLVWSGPAGTCPMERDIFSLLIIMIKHGDGWAGTTSTKMFLQMQLLDNRSKCHRYFNLRIQEWRIWYIYREQSGMVIIVQCQHGDLRQRLAWDPGIAGLSISLTDMGEWTFAGESCFDFPLSFSVEESTSLEGVSRRSSSTSFRYQHGQLMEAVLILVGSWRMDLVRDEAMSHEQEFHGVDTFQDYASQGIAVHVLIWDLGGRVRVSSSLDGVYCVSHMWTWDPGIILEGIWLLLEDKQFSSREDCNVPTLGHHYITEGYDDHSSQMEVILST
jgi:hypothetical protein